MDLTEVKGKLRNIWIAESLNIHNKTLDVFVKFSAHPAALKKLDKEREERWHTMIVPPHRI
ncbi:MAG: hypothetical protein ACTS7E_02905 [Arsenophonus sp. NC-CH8-MAG3]